MRTLFIECKMGAAGDMLMSALYELLNEEQKTEFINTMNGLFPNIIEIEPTRKSTCGVYGTHMKVLALGEEEACDSSQAHEHEHIHEHSHEHMHEHSHGHMHDHSHEHMHDHSHEHMHDHSHEHMHDHAHAHSHTHVHYSYANLLEQISALSLPAPVKEDAASIYRLIGEAEAKVHESTLENIHFHEVGSLDAICDVVGNCLLLHMLKPDQIYASPIHVGNGTVRCAHGLLPVPAPATAEILKGVPYYSGQIMTELCTPTGAAILKYFVDQFMAQPVMNVDSIGIGLGTKEFEVANMIRCFWGEELQNASSHDDKPTDDILDLSCNIDDMTGESLGFAMDILLDAGALDVFYQNIQMKKNRPGILLHCFCKPEDKERFMDLIFRHTSTRGIRFLTYQRAKLNARFEEIPTPYGIVHRKINEGYGITKNKLEYEDLKRIALEQNCSLQDVMNYIP